jgi:ABC-type Fe3+/spermidine/putrescine transport system ATPase subunit
VDLSFRKEQVLQNINLEVDDGEFCVIIGPSGCGKSTLLQSIAGLAEPDRGEVYFGGTRASTLSIQDRNLGYVFQEFEDTLFPHMTVGENVAFGIRQQKDSVDEESIQTKVDEMLEMLSIGHTKDDLPSELSGGQQQRVELARQLVRECDTMLLDDPLADLDYKLQKRMELEIRQIHEDLGSTFLYVTHNQDQALKLADKLVVVNAGQIEQVGTPSEVYHHPNTAFVARFVGDNNVASANLVETNDSDQQIVESEFGRIPVSPMNDSTLGETGLVGVRPEKVVVGDDTSDADTQITATLLDSIYMGDKTEIAVSIDGYDHDFYVVVSGKVDVDRYGDPIEIGWDVGDAQFFTDISVTGTQTAEDIMKL